jgi:hypothetical protein
MALAEAETARRRACHAVALAKADPSPFEWLLSYYGKKNRKKQNNSLDTLARALLKDGPLDFQPLQV